MDNTIYNAQHATGWIIGQILVARQTPAVDGPALVLKILEEDLWARGYAVGAYQAVVQGTMGNVDDGESYIAVAVCFAQLLGALSDSETDPNDVVQEFERLIGPKQLDRLQSDNNYIDGMTAGGQEVYTYLRKLANDTVNMLSDAPSKLFVHLAQDQCMVVDGGQVPNLPASMAIGEIYTQQLKRPPRQEATRNYVSKRSQSGTGCATSIAITAIAILTI